MGSSNIKEQIKQDGALVLELDKTNFYPGEIIKGQAHLSLNKEFITQGLLLEISGYEKGFFVNSENDLRKAKIPVVETKLYISMFENGIA